MKIRLIIDTAVDTKAHAEQIYDAIKNKLSWFTEITEAECSKLEFHKCFHDEENPQPCEIIEQVINGVVTWHNGEPVP